MTYNIRIPGNAESEGRDLSKAIGTITAANPDVIGLQEDDANLNVSALTGSYYHLEGNHNGDEYLDIFYKKEKFKECTVTGTVLYKELAKEHTEVPSNGADLTLDEKGDFNWELFDEKGRFFRYAVLETSDGIKVLVVNTHLHYGGTSPSDTQHHSVRIYQIRLLCKWLDEMKAQYPNQIVMGDMNADYGDNNGNTLTVFTDNGLTFARDTALVKGDVGATLVLQSTYADRDHDYVFDHILYRNVKAMGYTVIANKNDADNTRYPSDHLPVISEFICYAE